MILGLENVCTLVRKFSCVQKAIANLETSDFEQTRELVVDYKSIFSNKKLIFSRDITSKIVIPFNALSILLKTFEGEAVKSQFSNHFHEFLIAEVTRNTFVVPQQQRSVLVMEKGS